MSDNYNKARKLYQDIGKQTDDSIKRSNDPFNPATPTLKEDQWTTGTGMLLRDKIYDKYGNDPDRSLNYVEPSDPKNYGR